MITVGLDMSLTGTGFSIIEETVVQIETIKTKPADFKNFLERLQYITNETLSKIPNDVNLICVEDYFTPQNRAQMGAAISLVALGTLMRIKLYESKLPFVIVNNQQLKKFITGKGNVQKSMVLKELYKRMNIDAKDDNQADACVLGYIAKKILEFTESKKTGNPLEITNYQSEVVCKILEDKTLHLNISL